MGRSRSRSKSPSRRRHKSKHSRKRSKSREKHSNNKYSEKPKERSSKSRKRSHSASSSTGSDVSDDVHIVSHKKRSYRDRDRKMDEVERLAEMERQRRQREVEQKMVEEEAAKRIEELVQKRVEEELEKRKEEIDAEVQRRVEEAKRAMERQMMEEMEWRQAKLREEEKRREEEERKKREELERIMEENNRKIEEAQKKLAEERLAMVEEQRLMEEERQKMRKEHEKRVKEEQKRILGKNNSRPKLSFTLKSVTIVYLQHCYLYHKHVLVHDKLTELVQLAKTSKQKSRSYSFDIMNREKRHFVHDSCQHFGCESQAYDEEPKRNVVATAVKDKCWLPSYSLLEMIQREKGQRKVPGPVLNASKGNNSTKTVLSLPVKQNQQLLPSSSTAKTVDKEIDYFDYRG